MAHVSHKLSGSLEGALAGGGDPATSPLYVFGPFLHLIVVAGVAQITFGASIWLAVLTVVTVSAMYRLVMKWVADGSGGSGLSEEEFGPWAVKINASITIIEYTLTFLVSMAALVTFVADRFPVLHHEFIFVSYRTLIAIVLTLLVGVAVNRGPKLSAKVFGPATAGILLLLWLMIVMTIIKRGFELPALNFNAFRWENLHFTLGGYARILALMTGIEIFANLVAAYRGSARERSKKAFGSLLLIMGTTSLTMLIVGPAILDLSNPLDPHVSVFTQTMDQLLPKPLAYFGTFIGIAVLLSASAASAQGIQNLGLGLRYRHYIPAFMARRNPYEVADSPVWVQIAVCILCFLLFGTKEETYLALYAAGVFILLSLTGWAVVKRLIREIKTERTALHLLGLVGTGLAAILTTIATLIIFEERFKEGAWIYLLLVPGMYWILGYFRKKLGPPGHVEERLGSRLSSSYLSPLKSQALYAGVSFKNILIPLDQSPEAELALPIAQSMAREYNGSINLLTVISSEKKPKGVSDKATAKIITNEKDAKDYLNLVQANLQSSQYKTSINIKKGDPAKEIGEMARSKDIDLMVMSTHGQSRFRRWLVSDISAEVIYQTTPPLLVIRPAEDWHSTRTRFRKLLVTLDGSELAEQVLPFVHELAVRFKGEITLLSVPEGSESDAYPAKLKKYLEVIAQSLREKGIKVEVLITGSGPAQTILRIAKTNRADLIMMVSHGRGGLERQREVKLGSVTDLILQENSCPVFLVSAQKTINPNLSAKKHDLRKKRDRTE